MAPRILIIDDNDNIRDTLRLTLSFKGYEVREATAGDEGIQALREETFDLVFCDLAMPGMNGVEVIRTARQDLGLDRLPLIVLSAEERDLKDRALTAGATDVVDKPFAPQNILDIAQRYLGEA